MHSSGDFEINCHREGLSTTRVQSYEQIPTGERLRVTFIPSESVPPPYAIQVRSPSGQLILDRVLREAPTGEAQSAAPVEFVPSVAGVYTIVVKRLSGSQRGEATIKIG